MSRSNHPGVTPAERVLMAKAHLLQEARALVLTFVPATAQAKRVATGLAAQIDELWPEQVRQRQGGKQ